MKKATEPAQRRPVGLSAATLFDIPLIFDLMHDGAVTGAFASVFVERTGSVKLFWMVFKSILAQNFQFPASAKRCVWQVIKGPSGAEVGFLKRCVALGDSQRHHLELLAIRAEHRSQGIGTAVLHDIVGKLPPGAQLTVHCTKYARAMQHILKRQQFKRNVRFFLPNLEEYALTKGHCQAPDSRPLAHPGGRLRP